MALYSADQELNAVIERAYTALLAKRFTPLPESFKEIPYGVSFAVSVPHQKKSVSVAVYHSKKKGFSVVCKDVSVGSIVRGVLVRDGELGSDETGKGDIFGPLVVVAFCLGKEERPILQNKVGDSKSRSNEQSILFYENIKAHYPNAYSAVTIMPERYNTLIAEFKQQGKTLNDLLAWAHARAIETLMAKRNDVTEIVVDSFSARYSHRQLVLNVARGIPVRFEQKGERFLSVAAASMVARGRYLKALDYLSETVLQNKFRLISGSGAVSDRLLHDIVSEYGVETAATVSKTHFKNWDAIFHQSNNG